jgi:adenylate cyclase
MTRRVRRFLSELKRRKVYHVAAVYVVVAFAIWEAADIAFPSVGLPDAAVTFIIVVTALGFPLALVLAWAYEVRPESAGVEPAGAAPARIPAPEATPGDDRHAVDPPPASIAILPFDNMTAEPDSGYFADGIVEELTNALAQVREVRVVARTSAFGFRGSGLDVREVGRALGVAYLVEGSVRRAGDRLRVTAQLVDAAEGHHVWSERFERRVGDVFAIQDEIVEAVAESILSRLPVITRQGPEARTTDTAALDFYLRARSETQKLTPAALANATTLYEEAIARDPDFALAHAGLALALVFRALGWDVEPGRELMPRASVAAGRALALAPDLPEAHLARGHVLLQHVRDYKAAKREMERALELNPSFFDAYIGLEFYYTYIEGDDDEAQRLVRRAQELSPFDPRPRSRLGIIHYMFGRYAEAEAIFRQMEAEGSHPYLAWLSLGDLAVRVGRPEEAAQWAEKLLGMDLLSNGALGMAGTFMAAAHRVERAESCLRELERRNARGSENWFWIAAVLAALGRFDEAFARLDQAFEQRDSNLLYLTIVPRLSGLQDDARFAELLTRLRLEHWIPGLCRREAIPS